MYVFAQHIFSYCALVLFAQMLDMAIYGFTKPTWLENQME